MFIENLLLIMNIKTEPFGSLYLKNIKYNTDFKEDSKKVGSQLKNKF